MNRMFERWILGAVLGLAAVGGYAVTQNASLMTVARHAQTVAGVLVRQIGPAVQVATAATRGDFEPATAIARALVAPSEPDIVEPTNESARGPALVRVRLLPGGHRLIVLRARQPRCKRS